MEQQPHPPGPFARLAALGLSVFPLYLGTKHPAVRAWTPCRRRRPTPAELRAWDTGPPRNLAVVTGTLSGVIVLDVDGPAGARTLLGLGLGPGALPRTWCARTAKGLHLYLKHPGFMVRNRVGLLPGLDVRGDGGYAVAPPSLHPDGHVYRWVCAPEEVPLAEAPGWLLRLIRPSKPGTTPPPPCVTRIRRRRGGAPIDAYAAAALAGELSAVRATPEGGRNDRLNAAAMSLGGLVGAGALDRGEVEQGLLDAALDAGLGGREARATIGSGLEAGVVRPRALPGAPRSRYAELYPAAVVGQFEIRGIYSTRPRPCIGRRAVPYCPAWLRDGRGGPETRSRWRSSSATSPRARSRTARTTAETQPPWNLAGSAAPRAAGRGPRNSHRKGARRSLVTQPDRAGPNPDDSHPLAGSLIWNRPPAALRAMPAWDA